MKEVGLYTSCLIKERDYCISLISHLQFYWRKPEYLEKLTDLLQVTDKLLYNAASCTPGQVTTSVVIDTYYFCICRCRSNYHTNMVVRALVWEWTSISHKSPIIFITYPAHLTRGGNQTEQHYATSHWQSHIKHTSPGEVIKQNNIMPQVTDKLYHISSTPHQGR
jgi:hypothetical protein